MADGLFGDDQFGQFIANPMTQLAIGLLSAPRRDAQGFGTTFGQQLGAGVNQMGNWQQMIAQMRMQQMKQQQEQAQKAAQETFRGRSKDYTTAEGDLDPRAAVRIGLETGALTPQEALQQAGKMRRFVPIGGNKLFDTETQEILQGPPSPIRLGAGQALMVPDEQGGYRQEAFNPRQFAPQQGGRGGGLGKPPSGYRWTADGGLEAIPGGPAASREAAAALKAQGGPKLRESEAKAATYFSQMRSANHVIEGLEQQGVDPTSLQTQLSTRLAGTPANVLSTGSGQQFKQAQEQWAEAYLRFKTGAATNQSEIERNIRTFFPQVGDLPAVVAQKALARKQAEQDIAIAAGTGANRPAPTTNVPVSPNPNTPSLLQVDPLQPGTRQGDTPVIKLKRDANGRLVRDPQ